MEVVARMNPVRKGSPEDPRILAARLTNLERQLSIDPETHIISGTGGIATLYVPFSQHGGVVVDSSGWFRVPFACTITNIWVRLTTASSSGSVVVRVTDGSTNWDNTLVATDDYTTSTPGASLASGDFIKAQVTSAGTNAEDLVVVVALLPS